jgi:hypothetical protein
MRMPEIYTETFLENETEERLLAELALVEATMRTQEQARKELTEALARRFTSTSSQVGEEK